MCEILHLTSASGFLRANCKRESYNPTAALIGTEIALPNRLGIKSKLRRFTGVDPGQAVQGYPCG
jgi:hypothetical protein